METLYQPLKERQFRVLLLKDDQQYGFRCELLTLDIDVSLLYVALSYTWGEPDDLDEVKLHGSRISTQRNLARALRRLHSLGHLMVWADALCINQRDLDERASQVIMMRTIFERAQQVLVWLDPVSERTPVPTPFLNSFAAVDRAEYDIKKYLVTLGKHPDSLQFFQAFLKCTYWSRAWVMQEIAVAAKVNILLAGHLVSWNQTLVLARTMFDPTNWWSPGGLLAEEDEDSLHGFQMITRLGNVRQRKGANLLTMLAHSANTHQQEEVDVVYSKLGLASDSDKLVRHVDYSKSCRQVLIELAQNHIQEKRNLSILCMIHSRPREEDKLPTWVPDWRMFWEFPLTNYFTVASQELIFRAGLDTQNLLPPEIHSDNETLAVQGFTFDKCRKRALEMPSRSIIQILRTSTSKTVYADARDAVHSFIRTAFANHRLLHDFSAHVLPFKVIDVLERAMRQAYHNGTAYRNRTRDKIRSWSSRFLKHPDIVKDVKEELLSIFDEWNRFSIGGRSLTTWLFECNSSASQRKYDVISEEIDTLLPVLWTLFSVYSDRSLIEGDRDGIFLVPTSTEPGDEICILAGCDLPMVLRKQDDKYRVIGGCYVDGIMHGQAMREYLSHSTLQEFILI